LVVERAPREQAVGREAGAFGDGVERGEGVAEVGHEGGVGGLVHVGRLLGVAGAGGAVVGHRSSLNASTPGTARSFWRQRARVGPMLPTGMSSRSLIVS